MSTAMEEPYQVVFRATRFPEVFKDKLGHVKAKAKSVLFLCLAIHFLLESYFNVSYSSLKLA
ncbi:hypothetical protein DEO72_LG11g2094 [Vigna unguiculata]|uniref:Uncharacterized protein n=1 Tax=Vigna unguiculata TaxID=3917 RepID=A0A4D6NN81_VIGUN|nr:hypothetical protein DEO72_LG11g2094 [Vigna unguiculata]